MAIAGFGKGIPDLTDRYLKHRAGVRMPLRMTLTSVVPAVVSIVLAWQLYVWSSMRQRQAGPCS